MGRKKVTDEDFIRDLKDYPFDTLDMRSLRLNLHRGSIHKRIKSLNKRDIINYSRAEELHNQLWNDVVWRPEEPIIARAERLDINYRTIYNWLRKHCRGAIRKLNIIPVDKLLEDIKRFPNDLQKTRAVRLGVHYSSVSKKLKSLRAKGLIND